MVKSVENKGDQKRELNIGIRNLPESQNENVNTKVNGLLKDGLKLREITVLNGIRKPVRKHYQSGLIIATCKTREDNEHIMTAKNMLKESRVFKDVFILSMFFEQRQQDANFRTTVNPLGRDKLMMNGNHVIARSRDHDQTADTTHERRSDQFQSRNAQRNERNSERDRRKDNINKNLKLNILILRSSTLITSYMTRAQHVTLLCSLMQAVTKSKSKKAVGVDDLPGEVLRNDITCGFLLEYFNLCFKS